MTYNVFSGTLNPTQSQSHTTLMIVSHATVRAMVTVRPTHMAPWLKLSSPKLMPME